MFEECEEAAKFIDQESKNCVIIADPDVNKLTCSKKNHRPH